MTDEKNNQPHKLNFLRTNFSILVGILAGVVIGLYFEPLAMVLAPFGEMYVSSLGMCIIPIVITMLMVGVARLVRSQAIRRQLKRLLFFYAMGILLPSGVGVVAALMTQPGVNLNLEAMSPLGSLVSASGMPTGESAGLINFLVGIVPSNIFESLSRGDIVSIVFFSVLLGVALGLVKTERADDTLQSIEVILESFTLIFKWVLSLLPIGLCCVFAGRVAVISWELYFSIIKFILYFYLIAILLAFFYNSIIWWRVGGAFWRPIRALKEPLILAFTVDSSFVALASCQEALVKHLNVDKRISSLILPFGLIANRQGKIFLFAFVSIYLAQIYNVQLSISDFGVIIIASSLVGMAAMGGGVVLAASLAVVLHTINIPNVLAPAILIASQPIIDRVQSTLTVLANCALTTLADHKAHAEDSGCDPIDAPTTDCLNVKHTTTPPK
jgi:Na+/H+-dicarboxylate symporter